MKWAKFEDRVRETAQIIWKRPCKPENIGGVDVDGVIKLDPEIHIFIEITENRTLSKVREDIIKLQTAKSSAYLKGVMARCFCIVNGSVTTAMKGAAEGANIRVLSIDDFSKMFFDFDTYRAARHEAPFGSSINPITGEADKTEYVSVNYVAVGRKEEVDTKQISEWLIQGKKVILLGEYGTGKSRCIREVFRRLSEKSAERFCYPVAIDLRNSGGLFRNVEMLRRHVSDLGFSDLEDSIVRAYGAGSLAILLDGFDEIGSQAWSSDGQKLKQIRAKSLSGVKDTISKNAGGILITGREHYFPTSDEMFSALGLDPGNTIVLKCKDEFSDTELLEYFEKRDIELDVPEWLPRRPLICQTITDLAADEFSSMFGEEGTEVQFWNHFIGVLCARDARVDPSFDAATIFQIFIHLARLTRTKASNVGPISLADLQDAFQAATGVVPVEGASVMLQRLPTLGRISAESNDRQFVDIYILDGLRAKEIASTCAGSSEAFEAVSKQVWVNALDDLGQRILASDERLSDQSKVDFALKCMNGGNRVMACDLVAALTRAKNSAINFAGLRISNGSFNVFNVRERQIENLTVEKSYFGEFVMPALGVKDVEIIDCMTPRVIGITSASGLPYWIRNLDVENFDSVASVSRIRKLGLKPSQEMLTAIIRKTFFQKGSGRKEEALMRGLGSPSTRNLSRKILNLLVRENLLTVFKGSEGDVYAPVRAQTRRMQALLDQLQSSDDEIWIKVGELN